MNRLLQYLFQFLLQLWRRLLSLLRKGRYEREMEEEMRFHLEMQIEQNLASGMAAEEARYAARRQFGNQTWLKEASREMWSLNSTGTMIQDLRLGARMLRKNPGFTAVAVLTLALGIGANAAIFSVVEGILLKPLPYPDPEELLSVRLTAPGFDVRDMSLSASTYFIFREQSGAFKDIGIFTGYSVNVTGPGEPEQAPALSVTDGVLPILGVTPLLGRYFTRADDSPDSVDTVILTYGYWSRKFGGDPAVIGRTIEVDGKPRAIIGVTPESFRFLDRTNLAMLLPMKLNRDKTFLGGFNFDGIARLKLGATLQQANADVERMLPIVNRSFPMAPGFSIIAVRWPSINRNHNHAFGLHHSGFGGDWRLVIKSDGFLFASFHRLLRKAEDLMNADARLGRTKRLFIEARHFGRGFDQRRRGLEFARQGRSGLLRSDLYDLGFHRAE